MLRSLTVPWLCLLSVCCDKPDSPDVRKDNPSPPASGTRRTHEPREPVPDNPTALRTLLERAIRNESPALREKALAEVAWNAIEIDPEVAHEAFQRLPADSPERIRLIQHYAMRLTEQAPEDAIEWADALGTEQETAAAYGRIALVLAETDPRRAANLLSESGLAGREFDVAVVQVIQRWAAQSPPDAAGWIVLFPPGAAREAGIKVMAEQWLPRDAAAAFDWLNALQDEKLRKETARAMEGVILQQTPDIREAWLLHADTRIESELEQQRDQAIKDVGDNIPPSAK